MTPPAKVATNTELREGAAAIEQELRPAANVVEALHRVMRDLPAIGKDQQASAQQGGYSYRGIEQITQHTQRLFAAHGVVFTPHVQSWEVRDLIVNGKPWTDTYILVSYSVYGPGGVDDRIEVGPVLGVGRDNSDKGANKALTQTFKYALLQALSISDAKDDADGTTHQADAPTPPGPPHPLRDEVAALEDNGRLWTDFLARAGITDADADAVLRDNAGGWRDWLTDALSFLAAKDDAEPVEGAHGDGSAA